MRETVPRNDQAPLAQLDRATASGAVGQWFESTGVRRIKEAESANAALAADHNRITIEEATALLEAARTGEKIAAERARDFARAVLELEKVGRLALAVLDGGLFMGSRVVDLASAYLAVSDTSEGDMEPGEEAS
jgi:hypothetical protein